MQIEEERQGTIQIVIIDDHLDTSTSTLFESRLLALIESGVRELLIDCSALQYVNSAGLKSLLILTKKLELLGGQLVLCGLAPNVLRVFEMIGFTRILKITASRESALRLLSAAAEAVSAGPSEKSLGSF